MRFKMPVHRQRVITHYCGISIPVRRKGSEKKRYSLFKRAGRSFPAFNTNKDVLLEINFFNVYLPITFTKTGNQTLLFWVIAKTLQQKKCLNENKRLQIQARLQEKISRFYFMKEINLNLPTCFNQTVWTHKSDVTDILTAKYILVCTKYKSPK